MLRSAAIRQIRVTEQTYDRQSAGGKEKRPVDGSPAKQVRRNGDGTTQGAEAVAKEKARPGRAVFDLTLGRLIQREAASGTAGPPAILLCPSRRRACIDMCAAK
jgi:hypothetical protein